MAEPGVRASAALAGRPVPGAGHSVRGTRRLPTAACPPTQPAAVVRLPLVSAASAQTPRQTAPAEPAAARLGGTVAPVGTAGALTRRPASPPPVTRLPRTRSVQVATGRTEPEATAVTAAQPPVAWAAMAATGAGVGPAPEVRGGRAPA